MFLTDCSAVSICEESLVDIAKAAKVSAAEFTLFPVVRRSIELS